MLSTRQVLYVDDDTDDRSIFSEGFRDMDPSFEIIEACNGLEALRYLEEAERLGHLPSLIILDINMPALDGKQTLQRIRQVRAYRNIPVVLFSTSSSLSDKLYAAHYNVDLISKPASVHNLVATMHKLARHISGERGVGSGEKRP